ncbi:uncharacterized protein BJ171DRAFT_518013, partial [Polychytrium aggregatum]|uniref:uncharacterized protein n=1 Tax=Polychytrium aggregatum TaxID=110093 RepID=UPI0022FEF0C6
MDGFTEEQVSLIKMFHDIYLLEQTRNADMATKVAEVLDHWRSESNKAFLIRWKIAMEHACEKGEYNLVYHLLKAYANLIKDRPIITLRMVAMAVEAKSDAIFELLLEYTTRDSTIGPRNPDEVVINPLNKLNSDPKIRREQLLWRYCRITNQELAQQLGASFAGINCKANVNLHRRQVVAHLLDPPQPATQPGVDVVANSKLGQDCIWSSVGLGVLDISRQLREKGVNLDWMEDDHVEIQQEEQQKEANSLNLKTVLEPVAVALYAALGGAWERGTEVAPSHGPERNEIEKIINNTSAVVKAASVGNSVSDLRDDILELQGRTSVAEGRSSTLRRRATLRATAPRHTGRILIDPSDTVWTAFLSGKLEEVSKLMDERGSTDIGWMEPAAKLSAAENEERKAVTSSAEKLSNDTKATFGEETPDDAAISFFMALGGRI